MEKYRPSASQKNLNVSPRKWYFKKKWPEIFWLNDIKCSAINSDKYTIIKTAPHRLHMFFTSSLIYESDD